jgi:hypothetical protein
MKILSEFQDLEKSRVLFDEVKKQYYVECYVDGLEEWDMSGPYNNEFAAENVAENYALGYPI